MHCWNPDCQPNKSQCLFWDPNMFDQPCPDICMQLSAGNKVDIQNADVDGVISINGMVQNCNLGGGGGAAPMGTAFEMEYEEKTPSGGTQKALEIDVCMQPDQIQTITFTLSNRADDTRWNSMGDVGYRAVPSIPGLMQVQDAEGVLQNGGTQPMQLVVDTSSQSVGVTYNGQITVLDPTMANDPLVIPVFVEVETAGKCGLSVRRKQQIRMASTTKESKQPMGTWAMILVMAAVAVVVCGICWAGGWMWQRSKQQN